MDLISFFNTAFVICFAGTILFFVISLVLFFVFDIRTIYMIRSGRAQAKTVKEMQEANADTGRLRVGNKTQTTRQKKKNQKTEPSQIHQPVQPNAQNRQYSIDTSLTAMDNTDEELADVTEQLDKSKNKPDETDNRNDNQQTELLQPSVETTILSQCDTYPVDAPKMNGERREIYFDVVKKIIVRDTDEVIR